MFSIEDARRTRPARYSAEEWLLRLELAACYRVFAHRGWAEEIFNHITVRLPGEERGYLINPFGLHFGEVTAGNLVKIDVAGRPLEDTPHVVNRAGFVIHSAIHGAREDAHCIIHTHDPYGLAVACKAGGLSMDNFYAAFLSGKVSYHDFEGVAVMEDEQPRLVRSLGDKSCLILRNHGLLVAERDLPSAFYWYYVLQRACRIQVLSGAIPGPNVELTPEARELSSREVQTSDPQRNIFPKVFGAAVRQAGITLEELL
ncbi:class II aldolase/adducin family protein [Caldimonas tepidiphila]|uniref:class II aldolase/adducin family protein n=1 Tax=Caldimonas tepidiphila TaxID=2315841 RepID=UPI000E5A780C|nr:class II aldolase/adducin family protein [Caldimonas tepidiphila]